MASPRGGGEPGFTGNLDIYEPLVDALVYHQSLLAAILDSSDVCDVDSLSTRLIHIFESRNASLWLLRDAIQREVEATVRSETLFRGNSLASKMMTAYARMVAPDYAASALWPPMERVVQANVSLEVDPVRASEDDDVEANKVELERVTEEFLESIAGSLDAIPMRIRRLCHMLVEETDAKFPDAHFRAIGGFFFLRFLCPAVVSPVSYSIMDQFPSRAAHRCLILTAKLLQALANNIREIQVKESYMATFNDFLAEHTQQLNEFFDAVAAPVDDAVVEAEEPAPVAPAELATHVSELQLYLRSNMRAIMDKLEAAEEYDVAEDFRTAMAAITKYEAKRDKGKRASGSSKGSSSKKTAYAVLNNEMVWQDAVRHPCVVSAALLERLRWILDEAVVDVRFLRASMAAADYGTIMAMFDESGGSGAAAGGVGGGWFGTESPRSGAGSPVSAGEASPQRGKSPHGWSGSARRRSVDYAAAGSKRLSVEYTNTTGGGSAGGGSKRNSKRMSVEYSSRRVSGDFGAAALAAGGGAAVGGGSGGGGSKRQSSSEYSMVTADIRRKSLDLGSASIAAAAAAASAAAAGNGTGSGPTSPRKVSSEYYAVRSARRKSGDFGGGSGLSSRKTSSEYGSGGSMERSVKRKSMSDLADIREISSVPGGGSDNDSDGSAASASSVRRFLRRASKSYGSGEVPAASAVDWERVTNLIDYQEFVYDVAELQGVDLTGLERRERMAFWLNVYNMLMIHTRIAAGFRPTSVYKRRAFFANYRYNIGGTAWSLDDVFHGVLRGNPRFQIKRKDPRFPQVMSDYDPRVHFCCSALTRSSPAIRVFYSDTVFKQMLIAAREYCADHVRVRSDNRTVYLPKVFQSFPSDFGSFKADVFIMLALWLEKSVKEELASFLKTGKYSVAYTEDDSRPATRLFEESDSRLAALELIAEAAAAEAAKEAGSAGSVGSGVGVGVGVSVGGSGDGADSTSGTSAGEEGGDVPAAPAGGGSTESDAGLAAAAAAAAATEQGSGEDAMVREIVVNMDEPWVLNIAEPWNEGVRDAVAVSVDLLTNLAGLCDNYMYAWESVVTSEAFSQFCAATGELQQVDVFSLDISQRIAFFLNVYHTLCTHLYVMVGAPTSMFSRKAFFGTYKYCIGGLSFSLNDIYHGVLRGNPKNQFKKNDRRRELAVAEFDPRIHFAVSNLAKSAGVVYVYRPETLSTTLSKATATCIDQGLEVKPEKNKIYLPKTMDNYSSDFGKSKANMYAFAAEYIVDDKRVIIDSITKLRVWFRDWDWTPDARFELSG